MTQMQVSRLIARIMRDLRRDLGDEHRTTGSRVSA